MSSFTRFSEEPKMFYHADASDSASRDQWAVVGGFQYYINEQEDGDTINVPNLFITDGASVPRLFWSLIPPWGRYGPAAIVHDYLCDGGYINRTVTYSGASPVIVQYYPTRKEADEIFNQAMKVLKVPKWKRLLMYGSVRLFSFFRELEGDRKNRNGPLLSVK